MCINEIKIKKLIATSVFINCPPVGRAFVLFSSPVRVILMKSRGGVNVQTFRRQNARSLARRTGRLATLEPSFNNLIRSPERFEDAVGSRRPAIVDQAAIIMIIPNYSGRSQIRLFMAQAKASSLCLPPQPDFHTRGIHGTSSTATSHKSRSDVETYKDDERRRKKFMI